MSAATDLEPGLTSADVFPLLGLKSLASFRQFLLTPAADKLPRYKVGKRWLFIPSEVDAFRRGRLKLSRRRAVQHAAILTEASHAR